MTASSTKTATGQQGLLSADAGTDEHGRLTAMTDAGGQTTNLRYDVDAAGGTYQQHVYAADQDPADSGALFSTAVLDGDGNLTSELSPEGQRIERTYPADGSPFPETETQVVGLPDSSSAEDDDITRSMSYTASGAVETETDARGNTTANRYTNSGQLRSTSGTTSTDYDTFGRAYQTTDENGLVQTTTFDQRGLAIETRQEARGENGRDAHPAARLRQRRSPGRP